MSSHYTTGKQFYEWYEKAKLDTEKAKLSREELDWFVIQLTQLDRLTLRLDSFKNFPKILLKISFEHLTKLWQKRLKDRYPIQYLLGFTHWRNFTLKVTPDVLIPRPETEEIIEYAIEAVKNNNIVHLDEGNWVDLGTGSGAIACGLAEVFPKIMIHGVDCSEKALKIAQENAEKLGFSKRIKFYQGSWWQPLKSLKGKVKAMIANPPYIPTSQLPNLQIEVQKYEPMLALDGGKDGLKEISYLVKTTGEYLCEGGLFLMEIMKGQGEKVTKLLEETGQYSQIKICYDLDKTDRFVIAFLGQSKRDRL